MFDFFFDSRIRNVRRFFRTEFPLRINIRKILDSRTIKKFRVKFSLIVTTLPWLIIDNWLGLEEF